MFCAQAIQILHLPQSIYEGVLVNRVYHTPQGVPEFFRGVRLWWGIQGCTRCVFFKNNHDVSHVMFFAKPYLSGGVNCLSFPSYIFFV